MPHTYSVTINGHDYEIDSERELSDVQVYQYAKQQADAAPVKSAKEQDSEDSTLTQTLHEMKGVVEGLIPGAWSLVKGTLYDLPKGVLTGAMDIWQGNPPQSGKDLLDGLARLKDLPADFEKATHEERGQMIGNVLGQAGVAKVAPLTPRPIARQTGAAVEGLGKASAWPLRISGAHSILSGNPIGAAMIAAPRYIQDAGAKIRQWGEAEPAFMQGEVDNFRRLGGVSPPTPVDPGVRMAGPAADPLEAALAEARDARATGSSVGGLSKAEMRQFERDFPDPVLRDKVMRLQQAQRTGAPVPEDLRPTPKPTRPPIRVTGPMQPPPEAPAGPMASPVSPPIRISSGTLDKLSTSDNPIIGASKSKLGEMSATPGFTVNDLESVGLNPRLNYKTLTREALEQLKANRADRADTYRINAGLDKGGSDALLRD